MMSRFYRLREVAPDLLELLRAAPQVDLRRAALVACEFAIESSGLRDQVADAALAVIEGKRSLDDVLRARLARLVAELDDAAFKDQDEVESGRMERAMYLASFSRARAATALQYAAEDPTFDGVVEAVYEATVTVDDPAQLATKIGAALA